MTKNIAQISVRQVFQDYFKLKRNNSEKNNRGLVLTLIPTQKLLLDKHLNDTRFIYNQYVRNMEGMFENSPLEGNEPYWYED